MSTLVYGQPIFNRHKGTTMQQTDRTTNLQAIIAKVRALQQLKQLTGFQTTRSIVALLAPLTAEELVQVSEALQSSTSE